MRRAATWSRRSSRIQGPTTPSTARTDAASTWRDSIRRSCRSPIPPVTRSCATVGPFGNSIRPFTINAAQTLCFVNVNDLLGFEVGDMRTGKMLHRVEVTGFAKGPVKRHGCPSHGIGLTPDEKELWLADGANSRLHIFDATVMPPKQVASLAVRDQPGWITFSLDGRHAFPSTGEIIDTKTQEGCRHAAGRNRAGGAKRKGRGGRHRWRQGDTDRRSIRHRPTIAVTRTTYRPSILFAARPS